MATATTARLNGATNGATNGTPSTQTSRKRFSDIAGTIEVPVQEDDDFINVEIDLNNLVDDPTELCEMFENERTPRLYWMTIALAYAKQGKTDRAIEVLNRGSNAMQDTPLVEKLSLISCACWMYLRKSREAPRLAPEGVLLSEAKTKDYYLQLATSSLNEASRINPSFPPLFLARGVLQLLKASLQAPSKAAGNGPLDQAKAELLKSALKAFEQASKVSQGKNMLAALGRARALYGLGNYKDALTAYQDVLLKMPDLVDPDPRIGIGCCLWQLGYKDDAKQAWLRSVQLNAESKAIVLLGLYYLDASCKVPTHSPEFIQFYKKAMTEYTQKSFKIDKNQPLTCATFASYFLSSKSFSSVDSLANKAIQYTDVNAIASDGWYLLAKKEHYKGNVEVATDYYRRADEARGGLEKGYLPAKFGIAQLSVLNNDLGEAKLRLEKIIQPAGKHERNFEAMILLGTLYAEEVFANQFAASKEDKSAEMRKAIEYLEQVRTAWKDPKKNLAPDSSILLNLARLYEKAQPEKALQCLLQVEQLELDQIIASEHPDEAAEDAPDLRSKLRKNLPPQLLNNIGCFYFQAEKHDRATEMFQAALSSCMRIGDKGEDIDTDALVTTISFNLGRSYESQGLTDKAVEVYEQLIARHDDYTDAQARLAYIKLRKNPNKEGPDAVAKLYQANSADLEVRSLFGWYLGRVSSRKKFANVNEEPELRHYKHTLQNYDKHDRYALIGMGNLYLMSAREMRRDTEQDRQKRSTVYTRAVEFFDKALQLDPKNAHAAQGVAIALIEEKKDHSNALPIFLKVRETIKDANVYINIGHTYAELRQFSKAIENYEIALSKDGKQNDASILACLGRTWLNRARHERSLEAFNTALSYAKKALEVSPEQVHFKFNVAFVQIQLVQHIMSVPETQRNIGQLEEAMNGLEEAIVALDEIAQHQQPPYPRVDIEQRANMARNTQRKQLGRQIESQKEYEEKNKEKIAIVLERRKADAKRREEERQQALAKEQERQEKIRKEREEVAARERERDEARQAEEEAELTTDSETGEKVKRKRKPKPRATAATATADQPKQPRVRTQKKKVKRDEEESEDDNQPKKKRRLAKKDNKQYKSAEIVVDSSDEDGAGKARERSDRASENRSSPLSELDASMVEASQPMDVDETADHDEDEEEQTATRATTKRARRGRVLDDSDDEDNEEVTAESPAKAEKAATDSDGEAGAADVAMTDAGKDDEEE